MQADAFTFYAPVRVVYGPGTAAHAGPLARQAVPAARGATVVVDARVRESEPYRRLSDSLAGAGLRVSEYPVSKEPDDGDVADLGRFVAGNRTDVVVAVGGGSAIDLAKAGTAAAANPKPITDYEGVNQVPRSGPPLVAVPTTAGTGSEMGHGAVLIDRGRRTKFVVVSEHFYPKVSILDPELTVGLPPLPTAAAGLDALAHAMGSLAVTVTQPLTRPFALYAIRLIRENLAEAVRDGSNLGARYGMLLGSAVAGLAMYSADCAIEHVFGEVVGGYYGVPHGVAMGRFLPYSVRVNTPARPEAYAAMYEAFIGRRPPAAVAALAREFEAEVRRFVAEVGLPSLASYECSVKDISDLRERALVHMCYPMSAARVSPAEIEAIYKEAFSE